MTFYQDLDNYILVIATFLAAISVAFGDQMIGFIIFAIGIILKAAASAWDPTYTIVENIDNIILAISGVAAIIAAATNNPTWALGIITIGSFLKAVGSAYTRKAPLADNVDNVLLAITTFIAAALVTFGFVQYSIIATTIGLLAKGLLSTYFRNKANLDTTRVLAAPLSSIK